MFRIGVTPEQKLVNVLRSYEKRKNTVGRNNAYASDISCERKIVLANNVSSVIMSPLQSELYMSIGSAVHETIQEAINPLAKEHRIELLDPFDTTGRGSKILTGYADAIVKGPIGVEIKTCSTLPESPRATHVSQALAYSFTLGIPFILLYVSRNVQYRGHLLLAAFSVEYKAGNARHQKIIRKAILGHLYSKTLVLPSDISHIPKTTVCRFCQFKDKCYSDNPDFVVPFATEKQKRRIEAYADYYLRTLETTLTERRQKSLDLWQ